MRSRTAPACVCVPARNEAERLPRLLEALAAHALPERLQVVLAINNTVDRSAAVARACADSLRHRLDIQIHEATFAPELAHAGSARRLAMDLGAARVGPAGVLLSTDADARPSPDWVSANLRALAGGLDIVGGHLVLDEDEPLPPAVDLLHRRLEHYWSQVRVIEDALDPVAWDPPPRHADHTGASLALRVTTYHAVGGVPVIPSSEDVALVRAVLALGGRLGHPADVHVRVSPRRHGRAQGGMAECMDALHHTASAGEVPRVPALHHWHTRAAWRHAVRRQGGCALVHALEPALPALPLDLALDDAWLAPEPYLWLRPPHLAGQRNGAASDDAAAVA